MANQNTTSSALNYKRSKRIENKVDETMSKATYSANFHGGAVKRIRTPHMHDVLSGRGGGINSHEGNVQFRQWVADRKNDYNLAPNKAEKARVAREVIALVQNQDPPGRFLTKDPTSIGGPSWWIELDDDKIMAKTSQALREGAPQIRAAHREELEEIRAKQARRTRKTSMATPSQSALRVGYVEPEDAASGVVDVDYHSSVNGVHDVPGTENEFEFTRPGKRVRMEYNGQTISPDDDTPPLLPQPHPDIVPPLDPSLMPEPALVQSGNGLTRSHSLALSDVSFGEWNTNEEFVNPFENENEVEALREQGPAAHQGLVRDISLGSDFGACCDLTKPEICGDSTTKPESPYTQGTETSCLGDNSGVRCKTSISSISSSNSRLSFLSDLPETVSNHPLDTDFNEGMKQIHDALHTDVEDEKVATHLFPFRASFFRRGISSTSTSTRQLTERQ